MDWRAEGMILTTRPHGETSVIVDLFTRDHGRHQGVVRGGVSRRMQPVLQPGAQVDAAWRARLEDHVGQFTIEPLRSRSTLLSDRLGLAAMNAVTGLLAFLLPERDPHPALYDATLGFLDRLAAGQGPLPDYLAWELLLLEEMGYGLDLASCAVTGATEGLAYVSPKSGRAVSRAGAGDWADRLLPLPDCLVGGPVTSAEELTAALATTGYFLEHRLAADLTHKPLPLARQRFADTAARALSG